MVVMVFLLVSAVQHLIAFLPVCSGGCGLLRIGSRKSQRSPAEMEGAAMISKTSSISSDVFAFHAKHAPRFCNQRFRPTPASSPAVSYSPGSLELPQMGSPVGPQTRISAVRRRRSYFQSDTYVLLEPGEGEVFVSEEELKDRLKGWLENWPGKRLPPDLARFKTIDDAVAHLVRSVCELEIDGEAGSIQWYQVRLE